MSDPGSAAPASDAAMFQCAMCKRHYKRLDHLARHVRSHTQSKPYKCHLCPKAFGRADLLKRHLAAHESPSGTTKSSLGRTLRDVPSRVLQACAPCAANHIRCSEQKPCRRCTEKDITCVWNSLEGTATPATAESSAPFQLGSLEQIQQKTSTTGADLSEDTSDGPVPRPLDNHGSGGHLGVEPSSPESALDSCVDMHDDQGALPAPCFNFLPEQWSGFGSQDLSLDMDLNDVDLQFLDAYNANIPFELSPNLQHDSDDMAGQYPDAPGTSQRVAQCTDAFRQAYWRFRPNSHDHGAAEEHNLSLPAAFANPEAPETMIPLRSRVTRARLGAAARDNILTFVVQSCRRDNVSKAVAAFPSLELLDTLVQYYLSSPVAQADSFLHAATFDPNDKRPELVAAMAAGGAVLTADPALTKLGYAIQECVRVAVPKLWESDNTLVRDLELSQAFLITLEMGLWSGHGRKVEIAESFLQVLLTMLRRDGKLRRSSYPDISISAADEGDGLRSIWSAWVRHESFKRLSFRMVRHDTNSSMALLVSPLVSYAEVSLPFPDAAELWLATNVDVWKSLFASRTNAQKINLVDYLDEPEVLRAHGGALDVGTAQSAFLSCVWRLSWEFIQLRSLQRAAPRRWNTLIMASRQDELLKLVKHFQISTWPQLRSTVDLEMQVNHILLHLHMPLEDIQTFAGTEGPEQASALHAKTAEWARSEAARHAVYHAGQVIRAAKGFPRSMIQGPAAVMLYHAGLALWVYGLLSDQNPSTSKWSGIPSSSSSSSSVTAAHAVWLEEPDSLGIQRFTQFGSGSPYIRGVVPAQDSQASPVDVFLHHPEKVAAVVLDILRHNHEDMPRPPLVDCLIQLITAVQQSSWRALEVAV